MLIAPNCRSAHTSATPRRPPERGSPTVLIAGAYHVSGGWGLALRFGGLCLRPNIV